MSRLQRVVILIWMALGATHIVSGRAFAGETIIVELRDGRVIRGEVDPDTDQNTFWLRVTVPRITLIMSLDWDTLVRARIGEREVSVAQLRELVPQLKSALPSETLAASRSATASGDERTPRAEKRIHTLAINVAVANWDADFPNDGLEVRIYPMTADREVVPLDGSITVRLLGRNVRANRLEERFPTIGTWNVDVRQKDFAASEPIFRLPFQQVDPESDLGIGIYGEVKALLNVPGQGSFEASAPVRLRGRSPLRRRIELRERRRFLPDEVVDR